MTVVLLCSRIVAVYTTAVDATGESDVIGSLEPVTVVVGDDVILPCHLEPPFDVKNLTVEWTCNKSIVHVYRSLEDYLDNQDQKFKGRTSLFRDEMTRGNISLKLTNVTEQDSGNYSCFVPKLHSQLRKSNVTLIVETKQGLNESRQTNHTGGIIGISGAAIAGADIVGAAIAGAAIVGAAIFGAAIVAVLLKKRQDQRGCNVGNTEDTEEENNPQAVILINRPNANESEENNPETETLINRPNANESEENNPETETLINRPNANDCEENNPETETLINRPNANESEENNPETETLINRPNANESEENNPKTADLKNDISTTQN
ncbi:sodium channel subunit beta-4-like [Micropterus dolomieu]|uniref:sodium channel subunit beta-4-like n=1 Tax=Micropterus dolomieu TaxID=147949 RepID=UPI001E8D11D7|nr:sodium channel subunit beta-4-like [Micropterus dolomieu]